MAKGKKTSASSRKIRREAAKAVSRFMKRSAETKYVTSQKAFLAIGLLSGTPTRMTLCNINQGTGVNERIGNKIAVQSIKGRVSIVVDPDTSGGMTHEFVRLILARSKGSALASADFPNNAYSAVNLDELIVYKDMVMDFPAINILTDGAAAPTVTDSYFGHAKNVKIDVRFKNPVIVEYDDSTASPTHNDINLFIGAKNSSALTKVYGQVTVYYKDY